MTHTKPSMEERFEEVDKELNGLFNLCLNACLEQIRGEVTEKQREESMKTADIKGREVMLSFIKSEVERGKKEVVEEIEKMSNDYCQEDVLGAKNPPYDSHGYKHACLDIVALLKSNKEIKS